MRAFNYFIILGVKNSYYFALYLVIWSIYNSILLIYSLSCSIFFNSNYDVRL